MKNSRILLGLIFLVIMVSGCLEQSSQPYYLKEYCVDVPELAGAWDLLENKEDSQDSTATWFIEAENLKVYEANATISYLNIVFFRVDNDLFADITAGELKNNSVGPHWLLHVVSAHTLAKVVMSQDIVHLFPLNEEWLNQALENDSAQLRHLKAANSARLFTADSEEWIDFLKKHKDEEGFFDLENFYMLKKNPTKEQFFQFYQQWQDLQNSSDLRLSSRADDYILSEPYQAMIGLGETIVPLLIAQIREGEQTFWTEAQFFLWHAVSFLVGVDLSDKRDFLSEQGMAHKYIAWWDEKMKE